MGEGKGAVRQMIHPGDTAPAVPVKLIDAEGVHDVSSADVLGTGRVVIFTVPGAFTPTCHSSHLPGYLAAAAKLKAAGVDRIVCATVNDHHVVKAWAEQTDSLGRIDFIADGNAALARAMGLDKDMTPGQMGTRFVRAAAVFENGIARQVFVEDKAGQVTVSGAAAILMALSAPVM